MVANMFCIALRIATGSVVSTVEPSGRFHTVSVSFGMFGDVGELTGGKDTRLVTVGVSSASWEGGNGRGVG